MQPVAGQCHCQLACRAGLRPQLRCCIAAVMARGHSTSSCVQRAIDASTHPCSLCPACCVKAACQKGCVKRASCKRATRVRRVRLRRLARATHDDPTTPWLCTWAPSWLSAPLHTRRRVRKPSAAITAVLHRRGMREMHQQAIKPMKWVPPRAPSRCARPTAVRPPSRLAALPAAAAAAAELLQRVAHE